MTHADRKRAKRILFLMTMVFKLNQIIRGKDKEETEDFNQWKAEMNADLEKILPERKELL